MAQIDFNKTFFNKANISDVESILKKKVKVSFWKKGASSRAGENTKLRQHPTQLVEIKMIYDVLIVNQSH